jgi:uncharacterized protein YpuA (DUF1002 family)
MATWKRIAERAEKELKKSNKLLDVVREIISYDDRDEDEKIREIVELLND